MANLGIQIIALNDGTEPVYFASDLGQAWPEDSIITYDRPGVTQTCIPGYDESEDISLPGERIVIEAGGLHISRGDVEITLPYLDRTRHLILEGMYYTPAPFLWSPDNGFTVYRVAWRPGMKSYDPRPIEGFPGKYRAKLLTHVIELVDTTLPAYPTALS